MFVITNTKFALGDETRRALLAELYYGEQPLSQLVEPFDISLTAVSKHVLVLVRLVNLFATAGGTH